MQRLIWLKYSAMKTFLSALILSITIAVHAQPTATNFICNDCQGNPHNLFTELDTGCVVVIAWVMPCATCIGPSLTAYNVVQSYAVSHPGRVKFYIADDYANTTCQSLNSWVSSNGMGGTTTFSNAAVDMLDYGTAGMPKVVVLGGQFHQVYYNVNGTGGSSTVLVNAIDSALVQTGIENEVPSASPFNMYPNPAQGQLNISFNVQYGTDAMVRIMDCTGKIVSAPESFYCAPGEVRKEIAVDNLAGGIYIVELELNGAVTRRQLIIE